MCAGRPPFAGETVTELVHQIRRTPPTPIKDIHPSLPDLLAAIIHRALAKRPHDRHSSAQELLAELESVAKRQEVAY
jgi:serine/threonine-protein kinase